MQKESFKEKVLKSLFECAISYSKLLGFTFKIESPKFNYRKEYNIRFYEGNFLHLTGVKTKLIPLEFYQKTINKTLTINDFDCDSTSKLKGTVREKIKNLKTIDIFFDNCLYVKEKFHKGRVICLIASSNEKYTIGFTGGLNLNPMTLLNKNQIDKDDCIIEFKIGKKAFYYKKN